MTSGDMGTRRGRFKLLLAFAFLFPLTPAVEGSSVEALLAEINKLPPEARQKRLEDGARHEGSFRYYSVSNAELISAHIKGFTNRYPFVKAEYWRGSGNQLVVRTLMEHRMAKLDADVISVGTENVMALTRAGLWAR